MPSSHYYKYHRRIFHPSKDQSHFLKLQQCSSSGIDFINSFQCSLPNTTVATGVLVTQITTVQSFKNAANAGIDLIKSSQCRLAIATEIFKTAANALCAKQGEGRELYVGWRWWRAWHYVWGIQSSWWSIEVGSGVRLKSVMLQQHPAASSSISSKKWC